MVVLGPREKQSLLSDDEIIDVLEAFEEANEYEDGSMQDDIDSFLPEF